MALQFPQANPVLQKVALRLNLAGSGAESPILSGLAGKITLTLNTGETLQSWRIYSGDPDSPDFENEFAVDSDGLPLEQNIVFGTNTDTGTTAVRNILEWVTDKGTTRRQFFVKDAPTSGGIYVGNQEAQAGNAFFSIASGDPISFGINILPEWGDEFFKLHEYSGNRYANTLRSWGGAFTAQVFLSGSEIISECYVGDIHGYYWSSPPAGITPIKVVLKAAKGSPYGVTIDGNIQIEYT